MTELELQELSKAVAAKYGIESYRYIVTGFTEDLHPKLTETWLHNDSGRLIDLCDEHGIWVEPSFNDLSVRGLCRSVLYRKHLSIVEFVEVNNDKKLAARIARMKALLAKGE